ncbi:MAG: tyrosine-type recombinase/integrase [Xanthomonadales bacterium]|nr:tyrosine-type recombinase/integrase [Xanthomonadales bacterium]
MSFSTVKQQDRLQPRQAIYWHKMATGQHVGLRKAESGALTWYARTYDSGTQKQVRQSFGDFGHLAQHERFDAACRAAREWFEHLGKGGRLDTITVAGAWARYLQHQRKVKGAAAAADAESRKRRHIDGDPIATVPLDKLAPHHLRDWRDRIAVGKTPTTLNRDMVPMRAALRLALADGYVTTDFPWRQALRPIRGAGGRRTLYLTRDQRRALLDAIEDGHLRAFVHALCVLPLRPGALAALSVADFDMHAATLNVRHDKAGAGRVVPLPATAAKLLREMTRGKLPGAPLFARADGGWWIKHNWMGPIRAAAAAAELPEGSTAYTLRHSAITDLVTAGADLLTVATLAGTSVQMIQDHYGHLQQDHARAALAGLAL